jgi:hypothetical protein
MAKDESQSTPSALGLLPFAVTIFWGAFLLFLVQPLIGKYILPWFGGTPGVWTTCLLFFQCLLLGGYAYAHCLNRFLSFRLQLRVHGVLLVLAGGMMLLVAGLMVLGVRPIEWLQPEAGRAADNPTLAILVVLLLSIGLPYLVLSATGPLVQSWFAKARPGRSPYRLYALSNVGSLLALVGFPFVVEPWISRTLQLNLWAGGMVIYALVCGYLAWSLRAVKEPEPEELEKPAEQSRPRRAVTWFLWLALPACGTALLMATTNKMCQDVAVVPFLWVLPLALYLITFIISFDSPRWYVRGIYSPLLVASWGGVLWAMFGGVEVNIVWQVGLFCVALFLSCMVCHGELYRLRPEPARLTQYFLAISAGGALGGFFVAVLAPVLFDGYWEYHLALWVAGFLLVLVQALRREPWVLGKWHVRAVLAACWAAVCLGLLKYTTFDWTYRIGIILFPLLVGWAGSAWVLWISSHVLKSFDKVQLPAEALEMFSALVGVLLALAALLGGIDLAGTSKFTLDHAWSELTPGLWLALALLFLNLFVWLSVGKWEGFQLDAMSRILPLRIPSLVIVILAGLIIQWITAYYGMGYAEKIVWVFADIETPSFTLAEIIAEKFNITVAEGGEKSFEWSTRLWLALAIILPLNLLLWLGIRRQTGWGLQRLGTVFGFIPALAALAVVLMIQGVRTQRGAHHLDRNFYGTIKITHYYDDYGDSYRLLQNGRITHGFQYKDENGTETLRSDSAVTYYTESSGVGMAMELLGERKLRVGVVGLGVGTMAGFAMKGDHFCFYDINPLVVDLSLNDKNDFNKKKGFTYCVNARARGAKVEIVLADARLAMEHEKKTGKLRDFDLIVLDAFSSDSIPVHLLTTESMNLYEDHLNAQGVIAVHISNRYLNLEPVVKRLAQGDLNPRRPRQPYPMVVVDSCSGEADGEDWVYACNWILLTRNETILKQLEAMGYPRADLRRKKNLPYWRDDYASIFRIMDKPAWWPSWLGGDSQ